MASFNKVEQYGRWKGSPMVGKLYHWIYNAKWKAKLPYWDKFPLSIISGPAPGGFYGLNLHYLRPGQRKAILDELTEHAVKSKGNQRAVFRADYEFLQELVHEEAVKVCFKHYLRSHCESSFLEINPNFYNEVIRLPTAIWYNYERRGKAPY